jgi:predicted O-methyltransferase YrrM
MNKEWIRLLLGDRPRFDIGVGAIGSSARQFFMTGAVHALKRSGVTAPRILEIGSWIGYSTFTWARALERTFGCGTIVCIDPWEDYAFQNRLHAAQMVNTYRGMLASGLTFDLFMHNISQLGSPIVVQPLRGRSDRLLPLLREKSFDLVYIDGDHAYDAVRNDIREGRPLLKADGILCGDDLELELGQCDATHAKANRDAQPAIDPRTGQMFHPGVTLAVHEEIGSVGNYFGFWAVTSRERGFTPLNLDGESCFLPDHIDPRSAAAVLDQLKQSGVIAAEPTQ